MYTIELEFYHLEKVAPLDWLNVNGIYILWGPHNKVRPAYIGQGNIVNRLNAHRNEWMTPSFTGLIASTSRDDLPTTYANQQKALHDAKISEAFLLWVARKLNCWPTMNKSNGEINRLFNESNKHGVLKFNIKNYQPFVNPRDDGCCLDHTISMKIRFNQDDLEKSTIENCPWPRRT